MIFKRKEPMFVDETPDTKCKNCKYFFKAKDTACFCHGNPPTTIAVIDPKNRHASKLLTYWPLIHSEDLACHLFIKK